MPPPSTFTAPIHDTRRSLIRGSTAPAPSVFLNPAIRLDRSRRAERYRVRDSGLRPPYASDGGERPRQPRVAAQCSAAPVGPSASKVAHTVLEPSRTATPQWLLSTSTSARPRPPA